MNLSANFSFNKEHSAPESKSMERALPFGTNSLFDQQRHTWLDDVVHLVAIAPAVHTCSILWLRCPSLE